MMEEIPIITEAELTMTASKRYHGTWEVGIYYAGMPIVRYTISDFAGILLGCIRDNFPAVGTWLFSEKSRVETIGTAYNKALGQFLNKIKMDVANTIFEQGRQG
jgi:hypothetical protein